MKACNIVLIRSEDAPTIGEALRAALGLSLRGQPVCVFLDLSSPTISQTAEFTRALRTLKALGFQARTFSELSPEWLTQALSVEVW